MFIEYIIATPLIWILATINLQNDTTMSWLPVKEYLCQK